MLKTLSRPTARNVRRPFSVGVASEMLEDRIVLSAVAAAPPASNLQAPLAEITDVVVNSVQVVNGQLVANTTVFGSVLGRDFTENVQIPLNLGATPGVGDAACDILNLSLGPVSLNVLGLNINLDDCAGGPVTVDITGDPDEGLLGDLLCGIAGLLDGDGLLDLGSLTTEQLDTLTSGLTDILNGVFDELLNPTAGLGDVAAASHLSGSTDILNLRLDSIDLNLLGLNVLTSDICLDVTADSGNGNLLGNLLGSIAHLLDRNPGNAINALLNRVERIFDSLDLAAVSDELLASQGKGKR